MFSFDILVLPDSFLIHSDAEAVTSSVRFRKSLLQIVEWILRGVNGKDAALFGLPPQRNTCKEIFPIYYFTEVPRWKGRVDVNSLPDLRRCRRKVETWNIF